MCIIIYKPKGLYLNKDKVEEQTEFNPDGFGYAVREKHLWKFKKFPPEEKENFLEEVNQFLGEEKELIIHCRLSTAGEKNQFFAHPFNIKNPKQTEGLTSHLLFHNGHINLLATKNMSDTFILTLILKSLFELKDEAKVKELLKNFPGKFLITTPKVILFGQFYDYDGVYYSQIRVPYYYRWRKNEK